MSLKEFDYKQFLLEKGERVGLGIAVTLMVLMLIKSLFWPGGGIFSDSPKTKAKALGDDTTKLDDALHNSQPGPDDLPKKAEGRLIEFDKRYLVSDNYATPYFFEPRIKENPARRPPKIYPVEEAIAEVVKVNIDTYLFNKDFTKIWVLADKEGRRSSSGGGPGGSNPFAPLGKGGGPMGPMGGPGGPGNPMQMQQMQQQMQQMQQSRMRLGNINPNAFNQFARAEDDTYEPKLISTDNWNPQERTAHQLRPLRMTIIAGSFPYKEQLMEHKNRLHLPSTDAVLNETVGDDKEKSAAFDFRGVEVQRKEVDKDGKDLGDWIPLDLKSNYELWLKNTFYPFEPEDPKYAVVKPNEGKGLVMPLLREFHASKASSTGLTGMTGLMGGGKVPGGPQLRTAEAQPSEEKSSYPDIADKLPKLRETLAKLQDVQPNKIAAPKFQAPKFLNAFDPNVTLPNDGGAQQPPQTSTKPGASGEQDTIPDYVLVRAVDVNIEPGKHYRYRMKIKMVNPNYKRDDVASPEYKEKETLESKEWFDRIPIVSVPPEQFYYVVDERQGATRRDMLQMPQESAQYELWNQASASPDQVIMQFQRWVESTQRSRKDADIVPIGEWAVADRVYVARGEYVGRPVKVDLPMWIWTRNSFILPEENPKAKRRGRVKTGIYVEFGQENPENNLILVDFEGGRVSSQSPKMDDTCALEVLMLSPDGKLLARNSYKDKEDEQRKKIREHALKRIQEVREWKKE